MKLKLLVVLLLASLVGYSQDTPYVPVKTFTNMSSNYWFKGQLKIDSVLQARKAIFKDTTGFQSVITVPLRSGGDSTNNVASTKWVKQRLAALTLDGGGVSDTSLFWNTTYGNKDLVDPKLGTTDSVDLDLIVFDTTRLLLTADNKVYWPKLQKAGSTFQKMLVFDSTQNEMRWAGIDAAVTGGDTTIFETVLDSTGQANNRLLFSRNTKISSSPRLLFDSTNSKVVINNQNSSAGGPNTKLFVGGNTTVTGQLTVATVPQSDDTTTYKPLVIGPLGVVTKRTYWPQATYYPSLNLATNYIFAVNDSTIGFDSTLLRPRYGTTTSSATPTINTDIIDTYELTAQAADITSFTTNLSGTPYADQVLHIIITGTAARAITWGSSFEASTVALPTTTVTTNRLDVWFSWNSITSKWRCGGVW